MKSFLLKWMRGPAYIIDGLIITLTIGLITPSLALKVEAAYLDAVEIKSQEGDK